MNSQIGSEEFEESPSNQVNTDSERTFGVVPSTILEPQKTAQASPSHVHKLMCEKKKK